jgi:hypothetical protein
MTMTAKNNPKNVPNGDPPRHRWIQGELNGIRQRMENRDDLRETLIKSAAMDKRPESQKSAKNDDKCIRRDCDYV